MDAQYRMLYGTRQTNRKRLPRPFTGVCASLKAASRHAGNEQDRPWSVYAAAGICFQRALVPMELILSEQSTSLCKECLLNYLPDIQAGAVFIPLLLRAHIWPS
eukprot:1158533-Pelagomonas_calceolata.AAC.5